MNFDIQPTSDSAFDLRNLHDLFKLLALTSRRSLELEFNEDGSWTWGSQILIPSLITLTLSSLQLLREEVRSSISGRRRRLLIFKLQAPFNVLWRILRSFPSLRHLHLRNFHLSATHLATADLLAPLTDGELALAYPELGAILLYAERDTQILQVTYQDGSGEEEIKWHRLRPACSFQRDLYRFYQLPKCLFSSRGPVLTYFCVDS